MRRRERYIRNGFTMVGAIGLGRNLLLQYQSLKDAGQRFTWNNIDKRSALTSFVTWGTGGAFAGAVYYEYKTWGERNLPFNSDSFLQKLLESEHLKSVPSTFNEFLRLRSRIKDSLDKEFGYDMPFPVKDAGSFAKRTAVNSSYDLDLLVVFRHNAFTTLKEMYDATYFSVKRLFGNWASVEKTGSAFTVTVQNGRDEFSFDIIPARLVYGSQTKISIYERAENFLGQPSYHLADFADQRNLTKNKPEERKVIKLIKLYRDANRLNLPSVAIEQLVIMGLSERQFGLSGSITEDFLNALDFVAERVVRDRLNEVSNSAINLLQGLTYWEKQQMRIDILDDIGRVESNPRYLTELFS
ncbi:MAG: hypothetical protein JST21_19015 [Bacteroidetes bacterium]|nr:hypothetical protein [Bacteroidota bacterium]MBS1748252.1 hypothetical protein [Bacteroidota bacterium]